MAHLLLPKTPSTATEAEENEKLFHSSLIFLSFPLACTQKTNPTNTAAATATLPQPTIQLSYRPSGVFLSLLSWLPIHLWTFLLFPVFFLSPAADDD